MENARPTNPYKAGFGVRPPFLAGRHREINVIENALDVIKGRSGEMEDSPEPVLALVGPRGVGKTVLIARAVKEAKRRDIHVGVVNSELLSGSQDDIVKQVFPQGDIEKAVGKVKNIGGSIAATGVTLGFHETRESLKPAMMDFLEQGPLLLVLDEAHICGAKALKMFFDIVQECMWADLPLAVIIAGTPGLTQHLRRCKATYVERSEFLRFNTLSLEESREALEVPARKRGRPMVEGALSCLLEWSDNYPFFIQLVGKYTWKVSEARGGSEITVNDATAGVAQAERYRNDFYEERYEELYDLNANGLNVVEYAVQIADLVAMDGQRLDRGRLAARLADLNDGLDEKRAVGIVDALLEKGYLWRNQGVIEPGIPSLFDFVKRKRANE